MEMLSLMYVAVGGAFGSICRYAMTTLVTRFYGQGFPLGTMLVNIFGSFLMGVWIGVMATMLPAKSKDLHLLFAIGVLGGFTTFSSFSIDAFLLLERGQNESGVMLQAMIYIIGSVVLALVALFIGMWCVKTLTQ